MLPANVGTRMVIWQGGIGVVDGADVDQEPDMIPLSGTVTFTPSITHVQNVNASPNPVTISLAPIVGVLDEEGYLCTPVSLTDRTPMYRGVRLIATDDTDLSVKNWHYTVAYRFGMVNSATPSIPAHALAVPLGAPEDLPIDLSKFAPVPSSPPIGTPQALALLAKAEEAATLAATNSAAALEVVARADAGEFTGDPGPAGLDGSNVLPTDEGIAQAITTPASATATALSATIGNTAASKGIEATVTQHGTDITTLQGDVAAVPGQVEVQVPGLVADAIAADPTVADAAAAAAAGAVQDTGVVIWEPGKNLYDYTQDTIDFYLNHLDGTLTAFAGYRTSNFIKVTAGQTYTMSTSRQWVLYNSAKAFHSGATETTGVRTITTTVSGFLRFSYPISNTDPVTVQVEKGSVVTSYESYARIVSGMTIQGSNPNPLNVTRDGNALTVRSNLGGKSLVLTATLAGGSNGVFNLTGATLGGTVVHSLNDEPAPIRTQHGTVGANHGFALLGAWAAANHDKTTADLGSVWTDGVRQYVLLGIDGTGRAILGGDYTIDGAGVVQSATVAPAADLTHVSGSTHTAPLPLASKLGVGVAQLWPIVQRIRQTVILDGVTLASGTATGRELVVRESYEIIDYASLYDTAKANIGVSYTGLKIAGAVRRESVYTFREGGLCTVDVAMTEMKPTTLGVCGEVQAVALTEPVTRYVPGVKPIGGFDWSSGVALAGYAVSQKVTTADLHNPAVPPVLSLDVRADIGFALGYKPWSGGRTGNAVRIAEAPTNLWDLRSTKKSYPTVILSEPAGWARIETHAYRAYLTPAHAAQIASSGTDALAAWTALESITALA